MAVFASVIFLLSVISAEDICGYTADVTVTLTDQMGGKTIFVAGIADTPQKHEKGLMFCKELKKGRGLLFIFNDDRQHFFWMKNTPVELAIIYINSDFKVVSVRKGEPFSEKTLPSVFESRYVLEVNWAEGKKVTPGDTVKVRNK